MNPSLMPAVLIAVACTDKPAPTEPGHAEDADASGDVDGDGWSVRDGDCDDRDPAVHPDAVETCNALDDDCDGEVDEDASDATSWFSDIDGDGYGDPAATVQACEAPTGFVANDDDCDGTNRDIHPDAQEVCDPENVDEDCDGLVDDDDDDVVGQIEYYLDADYDRYGEESGPTAWYCDPPYEAVLDGTDCDDSDPHIHPENPDPCGDCDAETDCELSLDAADARILGGFPEAELGYRLAGGRDLDGDLVPDLVISGQGEHELRADRVGLIHLVSGDLRGDLDLTEHPVTTLIGEDNSGLQDVSLPGDLDGDGIDDLLVGNGLAYDGSSVFVGTTYVVPGPIVDTVDLSEVEGRLLGSMRWGIAGDAVAGAGDVDGDGQQDLLVGAQNEGWTGPSSGAAYLVRGPVTSARDLPDAAEAHLIGEHDHDSAGVAVDSAGDVDGDGLADVLVGAPGAGGGGRAYLLHGPVSGSVDLADADASLTAEADNDHAGGSVAGAGDIDGDGLHDVLVGAYFNDTAAPNAGSAYLLLGPLDGASRLADADARLRGEEQSDYAGRTVDGTGDVDGDGTDDFLVGAWSADDSRSDEGAAYLVRGPIRGTHSLADSHLRLSGETRDDGAGLGLAGIGDIDGDGRADILIGAPGHDGAEGEHEDAGAAYLVLGSVF